MYTDVLWCVMILWFFSYGTPSQGERPCQQLWEIEAPQVMLCHNSGFSDVITLQLEVNSEFVNVSSCNSLGKCTDHMAPLYTSKYRSTGRADDKVNYMSVDISAARKSDTTFRCVYDQEVIRMECVGMFVRPSKPVCEPLALVNSNTQIRISCASHKVFPDAGIQITALKSGTEYFPDNYEYHLDRNISSSPAHPGYNVVHFTVHIPLSTLEPSPYQFKVHMYPDISNKILAQKRLSETATLPIVFTAPSVRLSSDCPVDSYFTSGTCKCELSTPGNPPGQARWYTQSGQVVGTENSEDRSSTLAVSHGTSEPSPSYWCQAVTVLKVSSPSKAVFSPNLAFGPRSVIMETSHDGIFDLCQSEERVTTVTCKVATEDVKPGVAMTIRVNNEVVVDRNESKITGHYYVQDYIFRPAKPGNYSVICGAENILSSQLAFSKIFNVVVREPPSSAPIFLIPGNEPGSRLANVTVMETVGIICLVDGGFPEVKEVTITCGSESEQVQGKLAVLSMYITTSMDGLMCHCAAQHDSGCYDKQSTILLQVQGEDGVKELLIAAMMAVLCSTVVAVFVAGLIFCRKSTIRDDNGPVQSGIKLQNYVTSRDPDERRGNQRDESDLVQSGREHHEYATPRDPVDTEYITVIDHYDYVTHSD